MPALMLVLGLLVATAALYEVARRIGIPYPTVLVLGGIALAVVPGLPSVTLEPALVLFVFLPPLLFAAAFETPFATSGRTWPGMAAFVGCTAARLAGASGMADSPVAPLGDSPAHRARRRAAGASGRRCGRRHRSLTPERPDLDGAELGDRMPRGDPDGLVHVLGLDEVEAADGLLGLEERPVRHGGLSVTHAHGARAARRRGLGADDPLPAGLEVVEPGKPFVLLALAGLLLFPCIHRLTVPVHQ